MINVMVCWVIKLKDQVQPLTLLLDIDEGIEQSLIEPRFLAVLSDQVGYLYFYGLIKNKESFYFYLIYHFWVYV
jgi:hypothetical protein